MVSHFMNKKIALVTGSAGQDGSYLCELLISKKYKVVAADRRLESSDALACIRLPSWLACNHANTK